MIALTNRNMTVICGVSNLRKARDLDFVAFPEQRYIKGYDNSACVNVEAILYSGFYF